MLLHKVGNEYHLYDGDIAIATTIVGNPLLLPILSRKNCSEIFNTNESDVYAKEYSNTFWDKAETNVARLSYIAGFNKKEELCGDKEFSKGDLYYIFNMPSIFNISLEEAIIKFRSMSELKQVEVEIVTKPYTDVHEGFELEAKREPKLDKDGCLVLKKI
jgi:hypothetical protein